ncbi:hypothetical protein [Streptomyces sp. NPDC003023]|uniref:hypothetical protein n=1 Tax=Streptomyces sp. NPDC003023 TaxID=3364675 RepID=UPI003689B1B8
MQEQLSAQNAPIAAVVARAQQQLSSQARSAALAHQRGQQTMMQSLVPALRTATVAQALNQTTLVALRELANGSWQRQMHAAMPLLQDRFAPAVLDVVDTALQGLEELAEEAEPGALREDLSEETVREIEEALSSFEDATQGLPPAVTRRLWILWVQIFVFALSLQALVLLPVAAEVAALMGSSALPAAQQAGLAAARVWDRLHGQSDPAASSDE